MNVKILGSGCAACKKLEKHAIKAIEELGLDATVEKVEDFELITGYGVMNTPALVVDEVVKITGRVASVKDIKKQLV